LQDALTKEAAKYTAVVEQVTGWQVEQAAAMEEVAEEYSDTPTAIYLRAEAGEYPLTKGFSCSIRCAST
jgi:hypothetical protein